MADNNRRNRPSSGYGSNDNFNWEEYDMKTSSASGAPRRRRQAASTKPTSHRRQVLHHTEKYRQGAELKQLPAVRKSKKSSLLRNRFNSGNAYGLHSLLRFLW